MEVYIVRCGSGFFVGTWKSGRPEISQDAIVAKTFYTTDAADEVIDQLSALGIPARREAVRTIGHHG